MESTVTRQYDTTITRMDRIEHLLSQIVPQVRPAAVPITTSEISNGAGVINTSWSPAHMECPNPRAWTSQSPKGMLCTHTCRCTCHSTRKITRWRLENGAVNSFMGSMTIWYQILPYRPTFCNSKTCRRSATTWISVNYVLLASLAVSLVHQLILRYIGLWRADFWSNIKAKNTS